MMDIYDLVTALGVAALGAAVWLLAGWPGVLGYAGVLLIVVGVALAWQQGRMRAGK